MNQIISIKNSFIKKLLVSLQSQMCVNKKKTTLSLIIPVYQVSDYIERCLKSVIKQTYNFFECILVDDASPDDSIDKCEQMIATYEGPIQFRILHHELNRGLSAARNTGIDAATGDYLLFIDSDDLISDDCVERLITPVLKDDSIEMVIGELLRFSDNKLRNRKSWRHQDDLTTHEAVRKLYFDRKRHFPPSACNKLISRDFVNKHHLRFKEGQIWEDTLWTFFVMKYLSHVFVVPDITYFYYYRPASISSSTIKEIRRTHWGVVFDIISTNFTPGEESLEADLHLTRFCDNYVRMPKTKQLRETASRFRKALPFKEHPLERILLTMASILPRNNLGKAIYKFFYKRIIMYRKRKFII